MERLSRPVEKPAAIYDYAAIRAARRPPDANAIANADEDCPGCGWSPNECHCTGGPE